MSEIQTRTTPAVDNLEPSLTLSQLQSLLHAAAELERAQRPIVIHSAPQPATALGHAGVDVRVSAPPVATVTAPQAAREHNPWPLVFMVAGCVGLGAGCAAVATSSPVALVVALAALAAWGVATYQLVFNREA
jgi:hypothetical protein